AELGPRGISANSIRAGVTNTPALQKIPGNEEIMAQARRRNPGGRLTTPADVAKAIVVLSHPDTYWITGNVIGVDGGEEIVGGPTPRGWCSASSRGSPSSSLYRPPAT